MPFTVPIAGIVLLFIWVLDPFAPLLAATLFGALHLPNPFLSAVTFIGGVLWCRIYTRHPNILPLALSHALATMAILASFDESVTGRLRVGVSYLLLD